MIDSPFYALKEALKVSRALISPTLSSTSSRTSLAQLTLSKKEPSIYYHDAKALIPRPLSHALHRQTRSDAACSRGHRRATYVPNLPRVQAF